MQYERLGHVSDLLSCDTPLFESNYFPFLGSFKQSHFAEWQR